MKKREILKKNFTAYSGILIICPLSEDLPNGGIEPKPAY